MNVQNLANRIKSQYVPKTKTQLDELIELDKRVKTPARAFAYSFGSVGSIILGTGMSLAMKVIGASLSFAMPLGVAVGLVGLGMVSLNYFIYKAILNARKEQYSDNVIALSNSILNN